jgi:hypothetical protein
VDSSDDITRGALVRYHELSIQLAALRQEMADLHEHCHFVKEWMRTDEERSRWFYAVESDLREIVESTRYLKRSRRIIGWLIGATMGALMFWETVVVWVREHVK